MKMKKDIVRKLLEFNEKDKGYYHFGLIKLNLQAINHKSKTVSKSKDNIYRFLVIDNDSGTHLIVFKLIKGQDATRISPSRKHRVIRGKKEYYSQQHERTYLYELSRRVKDSDGVDLPSIQHINSEIKKYMCIVDIYPDIIDKISKNKTQSLSLYKNFLSVVANNRVLFDKKLRISLKNKPRLKAIITNRKNLLEKL